MQEKLPDLTHVRALETDLRVDLLDFVWQLVLEGRHYTSTTRLDQVLTFLKDEGWHYIVVVKRWHFYPDSLNAIPTNKPDLSVFLALLAGFAEFETDEPLDLRFEFRVSRVYVYIRYVQAPQRVARAISARVNPLDLLESDIILGGLLGQWAVIPGPLHRMWDVIRVS